MKNLVVATLTLNVMTMMPVLLIPANPILDVIMRGMLIVMTITLVPLMIVSPQLVALTLK
jgi:hypothetical protein